MASGERIAVLGAGPGGLGTAAVLSKRGYDVSLYNRSRDRIAAVIERGGVEIEGSFGTGFIAFRATTEPSEALKGASIVLIAVPAYGQIPLVETASKHLAAGATLVLLSGSCGSLEAAHLLAAVGLDPRDRILLGETMTLPQSGRIVGPAKIRIKIPARIRASAFPGRRTAELVERLTGVIDLMPRENVLDPGLNNPNFLIHPAPMLLNYAAVERAEGAISIMNEGMTAGVLRCLDAVDAERRAVAAAYGLQPIAVDDLYRELGSTPDVYRKPGEPFGLKDRIWPRYVLEDVPYGMVLISSLGQVAGVPTPVCDGITYILSAAEQVDFWKDGRTVARLGLSGLDVAGIQRYVTTGERAS